MISRVVNILIYIAFCLLYAEGAQATPRFCIPANDFGLGGSYTVYASPDAEGFEDTQLLRVEPKSRQIAPWTQTDLTTITQLDLTVNNTPASSGLKIYVDGQWYPWGHDVPDMPECEMINCDPSSDEGCIADGEKVKVDYDAGDTPCYLTDGYGLYGLIAINKDSGETLNPNTVGYSNNVPKPHFRTFHLKTTGEDKYGKFAEVPYTEFCDRTGACEIDQYNGTPSVIKGRLYFKILDNHYQDNEGLYNVRVVSGVYGSKGFIQNAVEVFEQTVLDVTAAIYQGILDSNFVNIVRALIFFYIVITALLFSLGMLQKPQQEILVRLIKVAIVIALISPGSWEFFNNSLFRLFTDGSRQLSEIVLQIVVYDQQSTLPFVLPQDVNALSIMDGLVKMLVNPALWNKILGLLLTPYFLYFFGMVFGVLLVLFAMVRIVMLYIIAIFAIAILIAVAPIFILMILFKVTSKIFDDWLKQLVSASIMVVMIAILSAMLVILVVVPLTNLLLYGVCWDVLWSAKLAGFTFFELYWWILQDDISSIMSFPNFAYFLLIALLYSNLVSYIPSIVDALAGAARQPISSAYNAFASRAQTFYNNTIGSRVGSVISYLPDKAVDTLDEKYKKRVKEKTGKAPKRSLRNAVSRYAYGPKNLYEKFESRFSGYDDIARTSLSKKDVQDRDGKYKSQTQVGVKEAARKKIDEYTGSFFDDQ